MLTKSEKLKLFGYIASSPGVLKLGPIYSTSGMVVPMTPDFRALYSNPVAFKYLAKMMAREANKLHIELLAGIEMAGVPLAAAASLVSGIPMVYVRKRIHSGWGGSLVDGSYRRGMKTALVDDAMTLGGQKRFFIKKLKGQLRVRAILVPYAPDYPKSYRSRIPQGVAVRALITKRELLSYLVKAKLIQSDTVAVTIAQLDRPLTWQRDKNLWKVMLSIKKRGTL